MNYTYMTTIPRDGVQASLAEQEATELRLGMNPHDVRGSTGMSVNQPMQYYEVHTGIPDPVDAHGRYRSMLESLYQAQPILPAPPPPPITYISEIEELYHTEWIVESEPFDLFYSDDTIGVPGNEFVADPMTGMPIFVSQFDRMYQPYVLPHPNHYASQRFQLITEVNITLGNAFVYGTLRPEDFMAIQSSILHQVPEEMPAGVDNLGINVENMTYEQLVELQERIGAVGAGLREETILAQVTRRNFQSLKIGTPAESEESESCCICKEEYDHGDDLAKLQCLHEFHYNCIKRWLFQKNQCPLCKSTAIRVRAAANHILGFEKKKSCLDLERRHLVLRLDLGERIDYSSDSISRSFCSGG